MNLPNKLTVLRVLFIPVFLAFFLIKEIPGNYIYALAVFAIASLTDMLDGKIARARGLITDFGVLMDPLADKLLVMAAMICFIPAGMAHVLIVITILAREFLVTSIRLVAAGKGYVLAADNLGKLKTVFQMVWICAGLLMLCLGDLLPPEAALMPALWAAYHFMTGLTLSLTVVSGINYVVKNRALFTDT